MPTEKAHFKMNCAHVKKDSIPCKRRVRDTERFCWQHKPKDAINVDKTPHVETNNKVQHKIGTIMTQRITSTTQKIKPLDEFEPINVLKWSSSTWKTLCPYYLKTDGNELNYNEGGILFENFYQGSKVYKKIYSNKVYPSRYHRTPKHLWWEFVADDPNGDILIENDEGKLALMDQKYLNWRNSLWKCPHPIRYPNGIHKRKETQFGLCIEKDGKQTRMDYLDMRKTMYFKEYIRLIKKTHEYQILLQKLKTGKIYSFVKWMFLLMGKKGFMGKTATMIIIV
jgi:hypothetical protein